MNNQEEMIPLKLNEKKEKEMLNALDHYQQDIVWFESKKHDLFKIYPYEWIAIINKKIVDHQKGDLKAFCNRIRKEGKFDSAYCVIDFVTDEPDPIYCFHTLLVPSIIKEKNRNV